MNKKRKLIRLMVTLYVYPLNRVSFFDREVYDMISCKTKDATMYIVASK